jgi:hypothetical protein
VLFDQKFQQSPLNFSQCSSFPTFIIGFSPVLACCQCLFTIFLFQTLQQVFWTTNLRILFDLTKGTERHQKWEELKNGLLYETGLIEGFGGRGIKN